MMPECTVTAECAAGLICNSLGMCEPPVLVGNVMPQGDAIGTSPYPLVDAGLGTGFACGNGYCLSGGILP